MAGLRERQKAARAQRILQAALRLFRAHGYGAVRIEDIAAEAEVSAGTLYNYFATKGDLLLAIVTMEVEEVVEVGGAVVDRPPPDVERALAALIGIYYGHSLHYLTKGMWRAAMALTIGAPGTPFSVRYAELDGRLAAQVAALLARLQALGAAHADVDPAVMGQVVFNNLNQMFVAYVTDEAMPLAALSAAAGRQNAALARLMAAPGRTRAGPPQ